jgi:hypothetical protein
MEKVMPALEYEPLILSLELKTSDEKKEILTRLHSFYHHLNLNKT